MLPTVYKVLGTDNKEYGPVGAEVLRHWIIERRANAQTFVRPEGTAEWRPLMSFPEFAETLAGQPQPAAAPPLPLAMPRSGPSAPVISETRETSGLAVASLVLGIVGMFSCGITALPGLIIGIVSLSKIRKSNGKPSGKGLGIAGICASIVSLLFTALLIILILPFGAAVTLPAVSKAKATADSAQCINNLQQIGLAIRQWETDHGTMPPDLITLSNQLLSPRLLVCPADRLSERRRVKKWSDFVMIGSSYNYFPPPEKVTDQSAVLVNCPLHDNVCRADGSVSGRFSK